MNITAPLLKARRWFHKQLSSYSTPQLPNYQTMEKKLIEPLTPEQKILIWSVQVNRDAQLRMPGDFNNEKVNWTALQLQSIHHQIFPLLYSRLKQSPGLKFPQAEIERLKMIYLGNVARNLRLLKQFFDILKMLNKNETVLIPYKGPVLSQRAYASLSLRNYVDLDFLVRSRDFSKIYQELTRAGYQPLMPMTEKMITHWCQFGREFIFGKDRTFVDIHLRITEGPNFLRVEDTVWDNQTKIIMDSREIPVLSVEDSVLLLCIHGTKHCWQSLGMVADIAYMASAHPELNWDKLISQAGRIGCTGMMKTGLGLAQLCCGLDLPSFLDKKILQSPRTETQVIWFYNHLFSRTIRFSKIQQRLIQIFSFDGNGKKMRCLGYYIFSPKAKDLKTFSLPSFLSDGYYFLRPVRLLYDFCKTILKSLFKRFGNERKIF